MNSISDVSLLASCLSILVAVALMVATIRRCLKGDEGERSND